MQVQGSSKGAGGSGRTDIGCERVPALGFGYSPGSYIGSVKLIF